MEQLPVALRDQYHREIPSGVFRSVRDGDFVGGKQLLRAVRRVSVVQYPVADPVFLRDQALHSRADLRRVQGVTDKEKREPIARFFKFTTEAVA